MKGTVGEKMSKQRLSHRRQFKGLLLYRGKEDHTKKGEGFGKARSYKTLPNAHERDGGRMGA